MSLAFDLKFILSYDKKIFIYSYFAKILFKKDKNGYLIWSHIFLSVIKWAYNSSLLFYHIIRFLNMKYFWHSWMNPSYLYIIFMYYQIWFVNISFKISSLLLVYSFHLKHLSLTSFDNGEGFPSFIRLYSHVFPEVWKELPYKFIWVTLTSEKSEERSLITLFISYNMFYSFSGVNFSNL